MAVYLLPDDGEFWGLLLQAEEVLLRLALTEEDSAEEPEPWVLPVPLAGRMTLDAVGRIQDAARPVMDASHRDDRPTSEPQLYAPDGRFEYLPLRPVELEMFDLTLVDRTIQQFVLADSPTERSAVSSPWERKRLEDVAELLEELDVDPTLWPHQQAPNSRAGRIAPFLKLMAVLRPEDKQLRADIDLLGERLTGATGKIMLTGDQDAAHQRLATHYNHVLNGGNHIARYAF
ncbi:hypothetical protein D5S17_23255 [Pseudonocardiaceae bacterium YIM PH 21723]|nr:hypothetical protein D5S17_23255 [Pseudonocardiaceae bacterium YIM PH 21723]